MLPSRQIAPLAIVVAIAALLVASAPAEPTKRVAWEHSRVVGSPEPPPPYKAVRAYPNATFKQPLLMVRAPGWNRIFVGTRSGILYSFEDKPDATPEVMSNLPADLIEAGKLPKTARAQWLYALVFHPKFKENRYCYICYTVSGKGEGITRENNTRISRFKVTDANPPKLDAASEQIVITWPAGGHNGCDLHFGPDGMLYISTGDSKEPTPPDPLNTGQDCSDLLSSILRIDVDRQDTGKNYAIPKDNPFVGKQDVRGEIWAFGFRNPWRMSFDHKTGELWVGDVGWELWEMVHKVEKGGNYGWSIKEGPQSIKPDQKPGPNPVITPPLIELPHTVAASVTGGYVYRGKKFPELYGAYIFADYEMRHIWAARFADGRVKEMPELTRPTVRISSFYENADGELYFIDYDQGTIHTLERETGQAVNKNFPTKLSESGLFASVKEHTPAPGVLPFEPAAAQWSDHATAVRWLAMPGTASISLYPKGKTLPNNPYGMKYRMHFPKDAVLLKTLFLETEKGKPASRKRIETQLLHFDGLDWRGYSFAWRDDQTDADLVPADGAEKEIGVRDPAFAGGKREQVWTFHSRTQCFQCHTIWSEFSMAFNTSQLNHDAEIGGRKQNKLAWLVEQGYIHRLTLDDKPMPAFDANSLRSELKLNNPFDPASGTVDQRARSYLHINCGHCHRYNGGGTVQLQLNIDSKANEMKAIDVAPQAGDFGLADAKIIASGDPHRSVLYYRLSKFGRGRMPHLGSELPDEAGLALLDEWIRKLPNGKAATGGEVDMKNLEKSLSSPHAALRMSRMIGSGQLPAADRDRVLTAAAKLPIGGNVRDLFEGYLPTDGKGRRLGANPRPAAILSLTGDAKRGETLFFTENMRCASCHKVGDRGGSVGPDLTSIAKTRSKADLLESLLEPSRRIDPKFVSFTVRTLDEKTITGLLIKRDDKQVVVRDSQGKDHTFEANDVSQVQPARVSLMPDGLLATLTAHEAADLLEYLVNRK